MRAGDTGEGQKSTKDTKIGMDETKMAIELRGFSLERQGAHHDGTCSSPFFSPRKKGCSECVVHLSRNEWPSCQGPPARGHLA